MIRWILIAVALSTNALLLPALCSGQEPPARPRIGLCLAGGGARGGAHIGVLRVLEELRVPVDCIAGTSIGSIIGGLYASGMSPAQMDSAVLSIDWGELLNDAPPRRLSSYRRKEEDRLPYLPFELGFGADGLRLPAGLMAGQNLLFLLRELTLHTTGVDDFDDMPIPFRSVAASLDDGSMVVLDHGTLADAMRASMAIPGVFTPHVVNGQTLVDGGILRNLPYDVVRDMGADIVIVVDVGKPLDGMNTDSSLMGVLIRTVDVSIAANTRESLEQIPGSDLLLVPDLEGIGVENFEHMAEAAARGEEVAAQFADRLRGLALSETDYEDWRTAQRTGYGAVEIPVGDVRVDSPGRVDPRRVRRRVKSQPGAPLDVDILAEDLSRVYRLGEFELVDFTLEPADRPPERDLVVQTRDKRWGPNYLRFGMAFEDHFDGRAEFVFLLYHRMAAINRLGAEWRNQISLGNRMELDSEYYQPLTLNGRIFVAPRIRWQFDNRRRWVSADVASEVKSNAYAGYLDAGLNMSYWGELRLGAYRGEYDGSVEYTVPVAELDEALGGWRGRLVFDQLDSWHFPQRGWMAQIDGHLSRNYMGATTEYDRLSATLRGAVTTGRTSFHGRFEGGTSFQSALPFNDRFELGGFNRLSGLERGRLFGDDMALITMGLMVRVAHLPPSLGRNVYIGISGEAGQAWAHAEKPALNDLVLGGVVFVGAEALLGPVYLGYGRAEENQDSFYLILGQTF